MKIKKNDIVKIIKGKDSGKTGKIIKIDKKENKAVIENLNLYKKHVRPRKQGEKGQIVEVPRPIPISNIMVVCPSCHKATRIGIVINNKEKKRKCKKCGNIFN
jgi:large subunit ribosomal protein L24